jgi:hypothetical protein
MEEGHHRKHDRQKLAARFTFRYIKTAFKGKNVGICFSALHNFEWILAGVIAVQSFNRKWGEANVESELAVDTRNPR